MSLRGPLGRHHGLLIRDLVLLNFPGGGERLDSIPHLLRLQRTSVGLPSGLLRRVYGSWDLDLSWGIFSARHNMNGTEAPGACIRGR